MRQLHIIQLFFLFVITTTGLIAQSGEALHFDGTNDRIIIGPANQFDGISEMTLEAWVFPTTACCNRRVFSKGINGSFDNFWIFSLRLGEFQFSMDDNTAPGFDGNVRSTNGAIAINEWNHVAVVYDGSQANDLDKVKFYLNGEEIANSDKVVFGNMPPSTPASNPNNLVIGARSSSHRTDNHFKGSMDEAKLWTRALSQTEIQNQMNCELSGSENGLEAYYQFNEGIASGNNAGVTNLPDISGNNHNGTLQNFSLNGSASNWTAPGGTGSTDADGDSFINVN